VNTAVPAAKRGGDVASLGTVFATVAPLAAGLAGYVVNIVFGYVLSPAEFGRFAVVQSAWTLWQQILRFGVPVTVKRFLASRARDADGARLVRAGLLLNGGICAAAWLAAALIHSRTSLLSGPYANLAFFVAGGAIFPAIGEVLANALLGFFEMTRFAIAVSSDTVVSSVVGIALALVTRSAAGAMIGIVCGTAATAMAGAWFLRGILRAGRVWLPRGFAGFAWWSLAGTVPVLIMLQSDVLLLRLLTSRSDADVMVGLYRAAQLLSKAPALLAFAFSTAVYPYLAYYEGRDAATGRRIVQRTVKYLLLVASPFSMAMIVAPAAVLRLVFPAAYATRETVEALRVLASAGIAAAVLIVLGRALQASGRAAHAAAVLGGASLVQIVLFVLVVPVAGIRGAAWSTLAGYGVGLLALSVLHLRYLGVPSILRSVFGLAPALGGFAVIGAFASDTGRAASALYLGGALAAYCVLIFTTGGLDAGDWLTLRRLAMTRDLPYYSTGGGAS
jgi:O-antigen/teichoic acid export membrane protein